VLHDVYNLQLAKEMLSSQTPTIKLSQAYDMWQLGILVYEAMAEQQYWPSHLSDHAILQKMTQSGQVLPHEDRPVRLDFVHKILRQLMHRDPLLRFNSADLIARLEQDLATAGVMTLNSSGEVRSQATRVLEG